MFLLNPKVPFQCASLLPPEELTVKFAQQTRPYWPADIYNSKIGEAFWGKVKGNRIWLSLRGRKSVDGALLFIGRIDPSAGGSLVHGCIRHRSWGWWPLFGIPPFLWLLIVFMGAGFGASETELRFALWSCGFLAAFLLVILNIGVYRYYHGLAEMIRKIAEA